MWVFLSRPLKQILSYLTPVPLNFSKCETLSKNKNLYTWDENWVFLSYNFRKAIVVFEISTLEFVQMQSFLQNRKTLNLGSTMLYFGIFKLEFEKNYCYICN